MEAKKKPPPKPIKNANYGRCPTKSSCQINASTSKNGKQFVGFNGSAGCELFTSVFSFNGPDAVKIKKGKFSVEQTHRGYSDSLETLVDVTVKLSGKFATSKKITVSVQFSTETDDCTAAQEKPIKFTLEFQRKFGG